MILVKDLWIHNILHKLSPIDLFHFQQTSKQAWMLTQSFQPLLNKWKQLYSTRTLDVCLRESSKTGHKDLVHFFIDKGANDWNEGLEGASQGGHKDLVQFFIDKGADKWNGGLEYATLGGNKDLGEYHVPLCGEKLFEFLIPLRASSVLHR
jgi:hypothetical protein